MSFTRYEKFLVVCLVLLLTYIAANFLLLLVPRFFDSYVYRPPSDSDMIRHFHEHEEEFEALLERVDEWPDNTLNLDWEQKHSSYVPPLDDAQIEEMRHQFKRLGIIKISVDQRQINDALTV